MMNDADRAQHWYRQVAANYRPEQRQNWYGEVAVAYDQVRPRYPATLMSAARVLVFVMG